MGRRNHEMRIRCDDEIFELTKSVCEKTGMSKNNVYQFAMTQTFGSNDDVPISLNKPNARLRKSIREAALGIDVISYDSAEALFEDLHKCLEK